MVGPGYWVHVYQPGTETSGVNAITRSKEPNLVTRSTGTN